MREKITSVFSNKIDELEISQIDRDKYLKKYSKSSFIELLLYLIIYIILLFNVKKVTALCYMSLSGLFSNQVVSGMILYILGFLVIAFLLCNTVLFYLGFSNKIKLQDRTYVKYHTRTENIQFFLKGIFIIYLVLTVIFSSARVDGPSMEDSFYTNDRVVLWHVNYEAKDDDVIVAKITLDDYPNAYVDENENESYYIKRVVAVEGDDISISYTENSYADLSVNGTHVEYLTQYQVYILFDVSIKKDYQFTVPKDKLIIMGDNRNNSTDSRRFGMLDKKDVMGKVIFRIYPFSEIGKITKQIKE